MSYNTHSNRCYGSQRHGSSRKVVFMKNRIGKFGGMNAFAAKALGLPFPYDEDTVAVWDKEPDKDWTVEHEKREAAIMETQGEPTVKKYKEAHAQVLLDMKDYETKDEAIKDAEEMVSWAKEQKSFNSYEAALAFSNQQAAKYKNQNEYYASEEYRELYPVLAALRSSKTSELGKLGQKAMTEAGVKVGDEVEYSTANPFGTIYVFEGKVFLDKDGVPHVKLNKPTVDGKTKMRWHKGFWKVKK